SRTFDPGDLDIDGYFPSTAAAGETYTAYLLVLNQDNRSYAVQPTDTIHAEVEWQASGVRLAGRISADMPLVTSPDGGASVVPLLLNAPASAGPYTLSLNGASGPLGAWSIAAPIEVGQQEAATSFPVPVRLEAWSVPDTARAGDTLVVDLTWRALGKIDAYYSTYVKLLDKDSQAVAGWDGQPRDGQAPTLLWVPGQTIDDTIVLDMPVDLPPGDYTVEAGMYRAGDLARCLTLDAGGAPLERLILGAVHIEP
ncbi:MAG: hypothetical protein PVG54_19245, partial [Anaerolineae bacterium]